MIRRIHSARSLPWSLDLRALPPVGALGLDPLTRLVRQGAEKR